MQVALTCRHGNLSADVQQHIQEKAAKLTTYLTDITNIQVTVDLESDGHVKVELLVDAEHKHNFVAHSEGNLDENVFVVFERTLSKMEQQIKKHKEKLHDHRRDKPLSEVANVETDATETESES